MLEATVKLLKEQEEYPVFLTSGCCDSLYDHPEHEGYKEDCPDPADLFRVLKLPHGSTDDYNKLLDAGKGKHFFPLRPGEEYLAEDWTEGPYGGITFPHVILFKGRRWLAPTVDVCFDGPERPFSRKSYGSGPDALYANRDESLAEAKRLADFLAPRVLLHAQGTATVIEQEPDRNTVAILLPVEWVVNRFGKPNVRNMTRYMKWVGNLTKGYTSRPSSLTLA